MLERNHSVQNYQELHAYVHATLCESENLLPEQFVTQSRMLMAKNQLCGIQFSLHGLRNVRLGAIWTADQNVIYFYNARGERDLKVKLDGRFSVEIAQSA
ncbi:MAG: hypothetical protein KDA80_09085 [Planctomycetaceae bacterium]|nr:hypothetical protein [Planctomycetaceae bacterium]